MLYVYNDFAYVEEHFDLRDSKVYVLPPNVDKNNIISSLPFTISYNNLVKVYKNNDQHVGNLLEYSDDKVVINENNNTIIIRNYDYIERDDNNLKILFSKNDDFARIMYRIDDIKSRMEYILYVADEKVISMVENMIINNDWNDVEFNKMFVISGADNNADLYRSKKFAMNISSMSSGIPDSNEELNDYKIYTHGVPGKLKKNTMIYTPKSLQAFGKKIYFIDSDYVKGPINYGYELSPSENVYNYPGKIIDMKTNVILSNVIFPKIQKDNERIILAGTTTSIIVYLEKTLSIVPHDKYDVYEYVFNLQVENENLYAANVIFRHEINFEHYVMIRSPDIMTGNEATWRINVRGKGIVAQVYHLSFKVSKNNI